MSTVCAGPRAPREQRQRTRDGEQAQRENSVIGRREGRPTAAQRGRGAEEGAGPHPHDAHVVHAHQPFVTVLRTVYLLPQLLGGPDVVPPRRVHPLEGQPAGLRAEARAGAGGRGQDPA